MYIGFLVVTVIEACFFKVNLYPLIILQESHLTHFGQILALKPNLFIEKLDESWMLASFIMSE